MRRALIVTAALLLAACSDDAPAGGEQPTEGEAQPDIGERVLPGLDGGEVDLASYRGTPLVLNFFASTCRPCVQEMPAIQRVLDAGGGAFEVVGIAVNDAPAAALALAEQTGVDWDLAADRDGSFVRDAGGVVLPVTVLLDADGAVVDVHGGELDEAELAGLLAEHLGLVVDLDAA